MKTKYEIGTTPLNEHPMPQAMRKGWQCLNGIWQLVKSNENRERLFEGEILVPFSPESINSGIGNGFVLERGERLIYTRTFSLTEEEVSGVVWLHFGAVDSACTVYINGKEVGAHVGGFTPFALDVSAFVVEGENEVQVICVDEALYNEGARGKQSKTRGGIWYTPQSGIWQTVWLEFMPKTYIRDLKITPNGLEKWVDISADSFGESMHICVYDGDVCILEKDFVDCVRLEYDFQLWSPEHPKLYDFTLRNESGDVLSSYFGVRSFGYGVDETGKARLTLNGKPYFFNGLLDQGYWSDGMLTYPSDLAVKEELGLLKDMGFNTIRKHIKLEPMRWYYHCDVIGLVVWQDFVNGGGDYKFTHIAAFPFLGLHHRDDDYKYFARENEGGRVEFMQAVDETVGALYNCPCIGVWVPFNEGWGQFDSHAVTQYLKGLDDTRIIDSVSGWHDQGVGKTTLKSMHTYYTPLKVPKDERPVVLSEFGGYSLRCEGHTFSQKEFGYKTFKTKEELLTALKKLYLEKLKPLIKKGLCGAIYTQVSDVEDEINGLVTYDRAVCKVDVEEMRNINAELMAEASKVQ